MEYCQRDGQVWHAMIQLASLHPDCWAPPLDTSGVEYLRGVYSMVAKHVCHNEEEAIIRFEFRHNYRPNKILVPHPTPQRKARYRKAVHDLGEALIKQYQADLALHRERDQPQGMDTEQLREKFGHLDPACPPGCRKKEFPWRADTSPLVFVRWQPPTHAKYLHYRETTAPLRACTELTEPLLAEGHVETWATRIERTFVPSRYESRRMSYRRERLHRNMRLIMDTPGLRLSLLPIRCLNRADQEGRRDPFGILVGPWTPYRGNDKRPYQLRMEWGITILHGYGKVNYADTANHPARHYPPSCPHH